MEPAGAAQFIEPLTRLALGHRELASGLRAVAAESTSRRLRASLLGIAGRIESGATLSEALDAAPALCPPYVRELMAAGAESNRLADVLLALGQHEQRMASVRQRLRSTILYPVVLLSLLTVGSVFMLLFVAAPIKEMLLTFEDSFVLVDDLLLVRSGVDRLWPYRWSLLGITTLLVIATALLLLRQGVGRWGFGVRKLPIIGPVWRWLAWSQTLDLWGLYLRSSIPLPRAVELTGRALDDPALAWQHTHWARQIATGRSLGDVLREDKRVPPTVGALLAWGDGQGALPEAVETAAEYCRDRVDSQLAFVEAAVPPIALVTMIVGLAYLYSMLLVPLRVIHQLT